MKGQNIMKILALTKKLLTTEDSGLTRRLYPFLKILKEKGHYITLISFYEDDKELEKVEPENEYYNKIITVKLHRTAGYLRTLKSFFTKQPFKMEFSNTLKMKRAIAKELKSQNYDILYSHFYKMVPYLKKYKNQNVVIDLCDCAYLVYDRQLKQEKNILKKFFIKLERDFMLNLEKDCINMFDKCIYISDVDRNFVTDETNKDKTIVIPNGVDTDYFKNDTKEYNPNEIIYIGTMSADGNHDAVKYFINSIYPLIKKRIPSATFKVIGAYPKKELVDLVSNDSSVTLTGKVDDVREYAKTAAIAVAPMRIACGLQNKILETMAMSIPTVTTTSGAEGITFDKNILLIENNSKDFADKVCSILENKELRDKYSSISRQFCINNFSWIENTNMLEKVFVDIIESKND